MGFWGLGWCSIGRRPPRAPFTSGSRRPVASCATTSGAPASPSDRRSPTRITLDTRVRDLAAVMDTLGIARCALFGWSEGGTIALAFAARHPERVSRLIVFGTSARSLAAPTTRKAVIPNGARRSRMLVRSEWGTGSRILTNIFLPEVDDHLARLVHPMAAPVSLTPGQRRARARRTPRSISGSLLADDYRANTGDRAPGGFPRRGPAALSRSPISRMSARLPRRRASRPLPRRCRCSHGRDRPLPRRTHRPAGGTRLPDPAAPR